MTESRSIDTGPIPTPDDLLGMEWFNHLSERERLEWLRAAGSARPVDAWRMFKGMRS
jgi:hypothetical protein